MTFEVLQYIIPQNLDSQKNIKLFEKATELVSRLIDIVAHEIERFNTDPEIELNEEKKSKIKSYYNIFHEIIIRIYFAASIPENRKKNEDENLSEEERKRYYFKIKLILSRILEIFNANRNILPAHNAYYFMNLLIGVLKYDPENVIHMAAEVVKSSEKAGYSLDYMALEQIMNFAETILADYRYIIKDGEPFNNFLIILDSFVRSGWPEAINFTYRIDEIYR